MNAANILLDKITFRGAAADWKVCWEATLRVIQTLAWFSFLLDLYKCKLYVKSTAVLGFELYKQGYTLVYKYMQS